MDVLSWLSIFHVVSRALLNVECSLGRTHNQNAHVHITEPSGSRCPQEEGAPSETRLPFHPRDFILASGLPIGLESLVTRPALWAWQSTLMAVVKSGRDLNEKHWPRNGHRRGGYR